jgi:hypothetical protein
MMVYECVAWHGRETLLERASSLCFIYIYVGNIMLCLSHVSLSLPTLIAWVSMMVWAWWAGRSTAGEGEGEQHADQSLFPANRFPWTTGSPPGKANLAGRVVSIRKPPGLAPSERATMGVGGGKAWILWRLAFYAVFLHSAFSILFCVYLFESNATFVLDELHLLPTRRPPKMGTAADQAHLKP